MKKLLFGVVLMAGVLAGCAGDVPYSVRPGDSTVVLRDVPADDLWLLTIRDEKCFLSWKDITGGWTGDNWIIDGLPVNCASARTLFDGLAVRP